MRIKNLETVSGSYSIKSTVQHFVAYEEDYIYIPVSKVYILHLIENDHGRKRKVSYAHIPNISLLQVH